MYHILFVNPRNCLQDQYLSVPGRNRLLTGFGAQLNTSVFNIRIEQLTKEFY